MVGREGCRRGGKDVGKGGRMWGREESGVGGREGRRWYEREEGGLGAREVWLEKGWVLRR